MLKLRQIHVSTSRSVLKELTIFMYFYVFLYIFVCMCVVCLSMYERAPHVCSNPQKSEEGVQFLGIGVADSVGDYS